MPFVTVARVGDIPASEGMAYPVGDSLIAVFRTPAGYHAINDLCPHMGASLAAGPLEDGMVTCPWHAWRFCVRTGAWSDNPRIATDAYQVRVEGEEIQILVDDKGQPVATPRESLGDVTPSPASDS